MKTVFHQISDESREHQHRIKVTFTDDVVFCCDKIELAAREGEDGLFIRGSCGEVVEFFVGMTQIYEIAVPVKYADDPDIRGIAYLGERWVEHCARRESLPREFDKYADKPMPRYIEPVDAPRDLPRLWHGRVISDFNEAESRAFQAIFFACQGIRCGMLFPSREIKDAGADGPLIPGIPWHAFLLDCVQYASGSEELRRKLANAKRSDPVPQEFTGRTVEQIVKRLVSTTGGAA